MRWALRYVEAIVESYLLHAVLALGLATATLAYLDLIAPNVHAAAGELLLLVGGLATVALCLGLLMALDYSRRKDESRHREALAALCRACPSASRYVDAVTRSGRRLTRGEYRMLRAAYARHLANPEP